MLVVVSPTIVASCAPWPAGPVSACKSRCIQSVLLQLFDMMAEHGYPANSFTYTAILGACNFKGRGLFDVAAVLYSKLATASGEPVPQDVQQELVKVIIRLP